MGEEARKKDQDSGNDKISFFLHDSVCSIVDSTSQQKKCLTLVEQFQILSFNIFSDNVTIVNNP